jgi:ABC-type transporter Mla MlaB component
MTAPRSSTIVCDVSGLAPDGAAVDVLARLQLIARRQGRELRLRHASRELQSLLAFVGLGDVLRIETGGESEERE